MEPLVEDRTIVAVGLLTRADLQALGRSFDRLWPVEAAPHFSELLQAIDRADRELAETGGGDPPAAGSV